MGELQRIETVEAGGLVFRADLADDAREYARAAKAKRTREAYRKAWAAFVAWCDSRGAEPLPAAPATVALYLTERAKAGRKVATIELDLVAISQAHKAAGVASPRVAAAVQEVRKGIRRELGVAQRKAAAVLSANLRSMIAALSSRTLRDMRDRAILLVGFAGAFRRSELVGLEVADLHFANEGLEVRLRRSKTDQEGEGEVVAIPYSGTPGLCPVRSLRAWLEAAGIEGGPVFRGVDPAGKVAAVGLTDRTVALVVKRAARRVGIDPSRFSGHSLRAGLATSAVQAGKLEADVMRQTRHKSIAVFRGYVRDARRWDNNAAAGVIES